MKLSNTATLALALLCEPEMVITVFRRVEDAGYEIGVAVRPREGEARMAVPPATFRKLLHDGMIMRAREWVVAGRLTVEEYAITSAGRAAVEADTPGDSQAAQEAPGRAEGGGVE